MGGQGTIRIRTSRKTLIRDISGYLVILQIRWYERESGHAWQDIMNPQVPTTNCWAAIVLLANECGVFVLISNRNMKILVLLTLLISIIFSTGCIEKQEVNTLVGNQPDPTPRILPQPNSKYDYFLKNWQPDDISKLSYGFCAGTYEDKSTKYPCGGYHLPFGSVIYHLKGDITKVYTVDNNLLFSVNDADFRSYNCRSLPHEETTSPCYSTHSVQLTYTGVIGGKSFVTLIDYSPGSLALLMTVNLNVDCDDYAESDIDWPTSLPPESVGYWEVVAGDIDIKTDNSKFPKIYNSKWYSIQQADNSDEAMILWEGPGVDFCSSATVVNDTICFNAEGIETVFRIYDSYNAFVAFYGGDTAYVQQLGRMSVAQ